MKAESPIDILITYGWMLVVIAIVGGAIFAVVQDSRGFEPEFNDPQVSEPGFNKSEVMQVVERGAGQNCEWETVKRVSGRIDCVQEFTWRNQSYIVHDYFEVQLVNDTVEISQ